MLALKNTLKSSIEIMNILKETNFFEEINVKKLYDVYVLIDESIDEDAPFTVREGGMIKRGYNQELDEKKTQPLQIGDLEIVPDAYVAKKYGEELDLTHREFELLYHLASHIGQVITREHLLETVWGYDYFGDVRTVDVTIRRLREKIEDTPSRPEYILTRRGVGYYMRNND